MMQQEKIRKLIAITSLRISRCELESPFKMLCSGPHSTQIICLNFLKYPSFSCCLQLEYAEKATFANVLQITLDLYSERFIYKIDYPLSIVSLLIDYLQRKVDKSPKLFHIMHSS